MNTEGDFTRGPTSVLLQSSSLRIQPYPSRVNGRTRLSYFRIGVGITAPEGNSERSPDRLAPTGGSLYRGTIFLLGLLHRNGNDSTEFFHRQDVIQGKYSRQFPAACPAGRPDSVQLPDRTGDCCDSLPGIHAWIADSRGKQGRNPRYHGADGGNADRNPGVFRTADAALRIRNRTDSYGRDSAKP